jgi:tetratricopeptide (TPR) repeat protein
MTQSFKCLDDDTLYKYIDKQLSGKDVKRVDRHLNECPECLASLSSLIKLATAPVTDEEKKILESIEQVPVEKRLREIMARPLQPPEPDPILMGIEKLKHFFIPIWKPALAFTIIISFSINFGYRSVSHQIKRTEDILNSRITANYQNPWLSGVHTIVDDGALMGTEDNASRHSRSENIAKAENHIQRALRKKPNSPQAQHLLFQILLLENKYQEADSLLQHMDQSHFSAELLNDIGRLHYQRREYDLALQNFSKALEKDESVIIAHYNKALTFYSLNEDALAVQELDIFMQRESNPQKSSYAETLKKNIQKDMTDTP